MIDVPALCAEHLSHRFGARAILEDVSLTLRPGALTAIVGANGAGKTTLLRCLAGLLAPDQGQVTLGGEAILGIARREVAQMIAVVPQSRPQAYNFSALELVLMGSQSGRGGLSLPSRSERDQAMEALRRLELESIAEQGAWSLSGGEMQRVLLARAMVSQAPIWLLDEPGAGLDLRHRLRLLELMRARCEEGGAILSIEHDLEMVLERFDQVAILDGGKLSEMAAPDDLLTPRRLAPIFGVRFLRRELDGLIVLRAREWSDGGEQE